MTTDTSEKGLETLIMRHITGTDGLAVQPNMVAERPPAYGGTGYTAGSPKDYDRAHALDVREAAARLPDETEELGAPPEPDGITEEVEVDVMEDA